jgi:hypothetical protein
VTRARAAPRIAVDYPGSADLDTAALCALIRSAGLESRLGLNLSTTEWRTRLDAITRRIRHRDTAIGDLAVAVYR